MKATRRGFLKVLPFLAAATRLKATPSPTADIKSDILKIDSAMESRETIIHDTEWETEVIKDSNGFDFAWVQFKK